MAGTFIEVGHHQEKKFGQGAEGDVFLSQKAAAGRIISVLSDGLGSGIKAGVLATLTATMAAKFIAEDIPIHRAAAIIMKTLPVCKVRRISYATFTIVDVDRNGLTRIIEYDNPPYLLIRKGAALEPVKSELAVPRRKTRDGLQAEALMSYSEFKAQPGDRLILYSDGVTQSGMGTRAHPLGWTDPAAQAFVLSCVAEDGELSARALARKVVQRAIANDTYEAKDDISCGVFYFREPRRLLVVSGPSVDPGRDAELAATFRAFPGKKIVSGGTTAAILARELGVPVRVALGELDPTVPPAATMEGADLVTEGIITLGRVAELLERSEPLERAVPNAASRIVELFLDSDIIDFVVGTRINEAHQDPTMPRELEIRRNVVKRIVELLEERHLKETSLRFI